MYSIRACLVCGEIERTIVAEYNRFIFMESMWQNDMARFDYALCHGCGLVYATRRPERAEYEFLYDNFSEFLMRKTKMFHAPEASAQIRKEIDKDFLPWWRLRSEYNGTRIQKILRADLANAITYLPYIMRHIPLEGGKVLHVRAKGGTLGDMLKRLLGAVKADAITLFPNHAYLAEKNEGIRATQGLDYEEFQIPYDEHYNLIIENHVFVHMLDPNQTFDVISSHLEQDGFIFFLKELSDVHMFRKDRNLFTGLVPFHFQQFDIPTVERMLRRYGFETIFTKIADEGHSEFFGIAQRRHASGGCPRISDAELANRLDMYMRWRDESILSLPKERCRALFGDKLDEVWNRVKDRQAKSGGDRSGEPIIRQFAPAGFSIEQLEIASEWEKRRVEKQAKQAEKEARRAAKQARRIAKQAQRQHEQAR